MSIIIVNLKPLILSIHENGRVLIMTTFKSKCGNFYITIGNNECGFFISLYNYKTSEYVIRESGIKQVEAIGILNDLLKQFC